MEWFLTLNLLTTTIAAPPSNATKWQMGFNSAFKGMHEKPTNTPIIHCLLIMYGSSYMFRHYIAIFRERSWCLLRDAQLRSSRQNIVDGCVVSSDVVRGAHHVTRHYTPIHNILSTAPQFSISQKALGTLPEDGNVMPKHVGATIHN